MNVLIPYMVELQNGLVLLWRRTFVRCRHVAADSRGYERVLKNHGDVNVYPGFRFE